MLNFVFGLLFFSFISINEPEIVKKSYCFNATKVNKSNCYSSTLFVLYLIQIRVTKIKKRYQERVNGVERSKATVILFYLDYDTG